MVFSSVLVTYESQDGCFYMGIFNVEQMVDGKEEHVERTQNPAPR